MDNITIFGSTGTGTAPRGGEAVRVDGAMGKAMSASRGILAVQGIGLSGVGGGNAQVCDTHGMRLPVYAISQDKPSAGWQPAFAEELGNAAARLRTAHPASVIRIRQRCRLR
ncbi:hypothetical protein [Nocardia sp. NPDC057353]|uniref:hypothetical protein n=1 Tax=Nocardia sp. NPDC057353 TaxID=3346104 RepID=UPI00362C9AAE